MRGRENFTLPVLPVQVRDGPGQTAPPASVDLLSGYIHCHPFQVLAYRR
jgi:hypothetical protein